MSANSCSIAQLPFIYCAKLQYCLSLRMTTKRTSDFPLNSDEDVSPVNSANMRGTEVSEWRVVDCICKSWLCYWIQSSRIATHRDHQNKSRWMRYAHCTPHSLHINLFPTSFPYLVHWNDEINCLKLAQNRFAITVMFILHHRGSETPVTQM